MADLEYTVGVNTRRASQNLRRLQDRTKQTSEGFEVLKRAIGALAIGALVRSSFRAAASIRDLSNATGIAVENILGFQQAFVAAGGEAGKATLSIERFNTRLGQAAQGSAELQQAFSRVGVSLQDLQTQSEQDILRQTVRGLADIESTSEASATGFRLLGRDIRALDLRALERNLDSSTASAKENADAFKAAGDTMQNFANAFQIIQQEILVALRPLSEFTNTLIENQESLRRTIRAVTQLAVALGSLFIIRQIFRAFVLFGTTVSSVFATVNVAIASTTKLVGLLKTQMGLLALAFSTRSVANFATRLTALRTLFGTIATVVLRLIPFIGQLAAVLFVVNAGIKAVTGAGFIEWTRRATSATDGWYNSLVNITSESTRVGQALRALQGLSRRGDTGDSPVPDAADPGSQEVEINRNVVDALASQRQAIDEIRIAYRNRTQQTIQQLRQEQQILGLNEEQANVQRRINEFHAQYDQQIETLRARYRQLNLEPEKNAELLEKVRKTIQEVTDEYFYQLPIVEELVRATESQRAALEAAAEAAEAVSRATEQATDFTRRMQEQTQEAQRQFDQLDMTPLERQLDDITNTIRRETQAEVRRLQQLLSEVDDPEAARRIEEQINRVRQAGDEAIQQQRRIAEEAHEHQRSFAFGWRDAFRKYADEATNAANRARRVFETTTRNMEDAIVNFARTGKFEWRSFVSSIVEELLRQQVRQLIAQTFAPIFGGGSGGSSDRGNLFGGFFATGGQIPAGRFGVVGEAGPELVSGPANVTPDIGGSNVTYNINAVDAQSFQQLVARDPQFIFAVTEQGRRSLPQTRR